MISVVIVNYNGGQKVIKSIKSVLKQKFCIYEIIVVDNGSTDRSKERVEDLVSNKLRLIQLDKNYGFTKGCNVGIAESHGEYVLLLNNDAYLVDGNALMLAEDILSKTDNRVYGLFPRVLFSWEKNIINSAFAIWHEKAMMYDESIGSIDPEQFGKQGENREVFGAMFIAPFFKKEAIVKAGGFDETMFTYGEDFDLSYRMGLYGYRCLYIPSIRVYHDFRSSSRDSSNPLWSYFFFLRNYLIVILKNYELKNVFNEFFTYTRHLKLSLKHAIKTQDFKRILLILKVLFSLLYLSPSIIQNRIVVQKRRKLSDKQLWSKQFALDFNPFFYNSKIVLNVHNIHKLKGSEYQ